MASSWSTTTRHGVPRRRRRLPVAVIDHHPGDGEGASFTDVRADHGACATIFAEYFETLGWEPEEPGADENGDDSGEDGEHGLPVQLATGLLYGIQSDTKQLTKGVRPPNSTPQRSTCTRGSTRTASTASPTRKSTRRYST